MVNRSYKPDAGGDSGLRVLAELVRGDIVESVHFGAAVEADSAGAPQWHVGSTGYVTTLRSSAKPLQAIPLVTSPSDVVRGMTDEELAICCASHPGEPRHVELVARVLERARCAPGDLVCGPAGGPPLPLKHGCSGNHAGIMLSARAHGYATKGYQQPDHPVQRLMRRTIAEMAGVNEVAAATDGCGIPTFALRLCDMARAFASLAKPGTAWERIPRAMGAHAELIGGGDWIDVRLMQVTGGRVIAKTGAEGLLCLALPGRGLGMAIKIADGTTRALGAVTLAVLEQRGWITPEEARSPAFQALRQPVYYAATGEPAARIHACIPVNP